MASGNKQDSWNRAPLLKENAKGGGRGLYRGARRHSGDSQSFSPRHLGPHTPLDHRRPESSDCSIGSGHQDCDKCEYMVEYTPSTARNQRQSRPVSVSSLNLSSVKKLKESGPGNRGPEQSSLGSSAYREEVKNQYSELSLFEYSSLYRRARKLVQSEAYLQYIRSLHQQESTQRTINGAQIKIPLAADTVVQGQLKRAVIEGTGLFASSVRRRFNCTLNQSKFIMISTYQSESYSVYYTKDIVDVIVNKNDGLKQNSFEL